MSLSRLFTSRKNRSANTNIAAYSQPQTQKPKKPTAWEKHVAMHDDGLDEFRHWRKPYILRLLDILSLNRNRNAPGHGELLHRYIDRLPDVSQDGYGNRFVTIGHKPTVMFTSHCDTMSDDKVSIRHPLCYNRKEDVLFRRNGEVLGADDGTGIWLMLEMIDAGVPGLYAFFMDEETGRQGSEWSDLNDESRYEHIGMCISFDRKGTTDIVGTQSGGVCCSETFQNALQKLISENSSIQPVTKARGSFTDSASFMETIPECTNLCVGYYDQHSPMEVQLVGFACAMRNFLVNHGHRFAELPVRRDPTPAPPMYGTYGFSYGYGYGGFGDAIDIDDLDTPDPLSLAQCDMERMCEDYPDVVADLLHTMGYNAEDLSSYISTVLQLNQ